MLMSLHRWFSGKQTDDEATQHAGGASEMGHHDLEKAKQYREAMVRLEQYIWRAPDGTLHVEAEAADAVAAGIDPVILGDLLRSLEVTNRMIERGELDPQQVQEHMP
jgi:hypothetical protein